MNRRVRALFPLLSRAAAFALLLALFEIVVLAAQPGWHERLHHHEDGYGEEECAVTLFAAGHWHDAAPLRVIVPALEILPEEVVVERQRIVSSFRFSGILEHAPPRRA